MLRAGERGGRKDATTEGRKDERMEDTPMEEGKEKTEREQEWL